MSIEEILELQKELDETIVAKVNNDINAYGIKRQENFLTERFLAMMVEVAELANATRCFKYWSKKPSESKERLLDELADCIHFMFSIAHTLDFTAKEIEDAYLIKHKENYKRQEEGY